MRGWMGAGAALLLAACGAEAIDPQEQAMRDEEIRAQVRESQETPLVAADPEPIRYTDIEAAEAFGVSCSFLPEGAGLGAVALAMPDEGWLKLDGEMVRLAPDTGSTPSPLETWSRYDGQKHSFTLRIGDGEGRQSGSETVDFEDAELTIRDRYDRVVYNRAGTAQCGS